MVWYRLSLKLGIRKLMFPTEVPIKGLFFVTTPKISEYPEEWKPNLRQTADAIVNGRFTWFSYHEFEVGDIPNWYKNPFSSEVIADPLRHWTELSDFDLNIGDIKTIWEPSRFDWLTHLARAYRVFGDETYLSTINRWLNDWSEKNPLNLGPNWKCGQETSIRVMKLLNAAFILDQLDDPSPVLQELTHQHLARIAGNINYAVAQDNNHGTSEAAALYIGATWLLQKGNVSSIDKASLRNWQQSGLRIWNNRLLHLIGTDGTFSQRSITYHRVVVDTVSFTLFFTGRLALPKPLPAVQRKMEVLVSWQLKFIIPQNGDSPNMGSNDGAMFENLHGCGYRDFRPSAQLAHWLCFESRPFSSGPWDEVLFWRNPTEWRNIPIKEMEQPAAEILDGQFLIMRNGGTDVFLRIPNDSFRPLASDAFHLDVWRNGKNHICGCGSYSYNSQEPFAHYFKSIKGHNTVQFGKHEQMPRISKFLLGKWINASKMGKVTRLEDGSLSWSGTYTDAYGNEHSRLLNLKADGALEITDRVNTDETWIVRYNLPANNSVIAHNRCFSEDCELSVDNGLVMTIEPGFTSTHYLLCTPSQALSIAGDKQSSLTVSIAWL